jgi:hypothetical protein
MADPLARKSTATRIGGVGFLLGSAYMGAEASILHPGGALSRMPVLAALYGGLMLGIVFAGAAFSWRRFPRSMSKLNRHPR